MSKTVIWATRKHEAVRVPTGVSISNSPDGVMTVTESGFVQKCVLCNVPWPCVAARIAALEAENARLRVALEVCVEAISDGVRELPRGGMTGGGEPFHLISPTWKNFHLALTRARAALAASAGEAG